MRARQNDETEKRSKKSGAPARCNDPVNLGIAGYIEQNESLDIWGPQLLLLAFQDSAQITLVLIRASLSKDSMTTGILGCPPSVPIDLVPLTEP